MKLIFQTIISKRSSYGFINDYFYKKMGSVIQCVDKNHKQDELIRL